MVRGIELGYELFVPKLKREITLSFRNICHAPLKPKGIFRKSLFFLYPITTGIGLQVFKKLLLQPNLLLYMLCKLYIF